MKTRKIFISAESLCRNCKGAGQTNGQPCEICEGYGMVVVAKEINVTITPLKSSINPKN